MKTANSVFFVVGNGPEGVAVVVVVAGHPLSAIEMAKACVNEERTLTFKTIAAWDWSASVMPGLHDQFERLGALSAHLHIIS